ncbi:MAG: co-chaperone GroES [Minisyncoccia bacterium]
MNKKKTKKPVKKQASGATRHASNAPGIVPLGDRVLIKPASPDESGTTTAFGIIIPDTVDKEKPEQGTVVAVGPGKRDENGHTFAPNVSVGDRVMFSKYGFDEIKVDGVEYYIVSESNILAIIK